MKHYTSCAPDCTVEHQPRERSVRCAGCLRPTLALSGVCERCSGDLGEHLDRQADRGLDRLDRESGVLL